MLNKWIGLKPWTTAQGSRHTEPVAGGGKMTGKKWLMVTLGVLAIATPAWAAIIWQTGFEGGTMPTSVLATEPCGDKYTGCGCAGVGVSLRTSTTYKREGSYSGQAILKQCHERAEWREITANQPKVGDRRYYGFSLKTPSNFDTSRWTIVQQGIQFYGTEENPMPAWADTPGGWHTLKIDKGRWVYSLKRTPLGQTATSEPIVKDLGPVLRGTWTDFVIRGDWFADGNGNLEVWMRQQGEPGYTLVHSLYNQPVILKVDKAPVFKIGLYRGDPGWTGANTTETIYMDSIRIGQSFNEVKAP